MSMIGYRVTCRSFISKYAIFDESGDHQYAVTASSSSGYTQSSFPLRISSLPPVVRAFVSPVPMFATQRLKLRTKLSNLESGENLGSSISCSLVTIVFDVMDLRSRTTRLLLPTKRSEFASGDQM